MKTTIQVGVISETSSGNKLVTVIASEHGIDGKVNMIVAQMERSYAVRLGEQILDAARSLESAGRPQL